MINKQSTSVKHWIVASLETTNGIHAMVFDTIKDENFVFKNTYVKDKQVVISMKQSPLEFYCLHMKLSPNAIKALRASGLGSRRPRQNVSN